MCGILFPIVSDPDEAFSRVPYEKGHSLLYHLETLVGGAHVFDQFLRAYVQKFAGRTLTSGDFVTFLNEFFESSQRNFNLRKLSKPLVSIDSGAIASIDWNSWFHVPGMPPAELNFERSMFDQCEEAAKSIQQCKDAEINTEASSLFCALSTTQKRN